MNTTATTGHAPMTPLRRTALIAGLLYIATFVFSIPVKFWLWHDVLNDPNFVLGSGSDSGVRMGAIFEILTALTGIGTAVALYAVTRRYSSRAALGFVTSRVIEAAMIFTGVLAIMSVYILRNDPAATAGTDSASLLTTGHAFVAIHDWTFLLGPGLMAAVNAFCLGSVMYRSRLVPRIIPAIGLMGAPLLIASNVAVLFGKWDQLSSIAGLLTLPIAAWEFSVGVWMTVKGFRTSEVAEDVPVSTNLAIAGIAA